MPAAAFQSPRPLGEDRAYLDFVLGLKQHFARDVYPRLHQQYERRRPAAAATHPGKPDASAAAAAPAAADDPQAVARLVGELPAYPLFQWLERYPQLMMWRRLEAMLRPHEAQLTAALEPPAEHAPLGSLELDPDLRLPAYYAETDFHIQPGGVWSSVTSSFVYEVGAKIVMMGDNDEYQFHRSFVTTAIPRRAYRAILDLGCGFGKSTRPFVDAFPEAEVVGIDLSAPNLKLAHQQAERLGKRIAFSQRAAEDTRYPSAAFDLVTATMLIHELPMPVLRQVLREARRVMRPGGLLAVLDFARTGDPLRDFVMDGHGARNNEPYLPHLFRTDLPRLLLETGFRDPEVRAFDERGAGLLADATWPTRSEWHFPWVVVRAGA